MRALSFSAQRHGINRQRIKAGAKAEQLYDLVNGYVTGARTIVNREGTIRDTVLASHTRGLTAFDGLLQTFSHQFEAYTPVGYLANVLSHPTDDTATLTRIHFAQPFMGALYVVAEWNDGEVYHYWLASSGEWEADKVYFDGDVVTPTTPNGLLYKAVANNPNSAGLQTWQALTNYSLGDRVLPTTYNGYYFEVTETAGDVPISGPSEPSWNASEGAPTTEATDASGTAAANASSDSAPSVPPDIQDRYGTGQTALTEAATAAVGLSDTIPLWAPGTVYQPGDLVKPRSVAPVISSDIPNADFELGDQDWTKGDGWSITNATGSGKADAPYQGAYYAAFEPPDDQTVYSYLSMNTTVPVVPGQFIQASCYGAQNNSNNPNTTTSIVMLWYDAYDTLVKETVGTTYSTDSAKNYRVYSVQDTTPGDAVTVKVAFKALREANTSAHLISVDTFAWNYVNITPAEADFTTYQAVQAAAGTSGASEPVWPGAGNSVVDNQVTWLGGVNSVITWTAYPIMKSGSVEPTWVEQVGAASPDNTISWTATTGLVEEAPQSTIVVLGAKKVFAADGDIVRYSATVNPLDWTTVDDAGYLPTGLNTYGANPAAAMGLYRGNLMVFNSGGFQMWQIDEDPELMSLLDACPVGSTYHHALQAVKNDLVFLTQLGYRNVSIAGGSTNLQAGDFGQPIDALVQAQLLAGTYEANSFYYPAQGQYWGIFGPQAFVCTFDDDGRSWSRYEFPEAITDATLLDDALYLRTSGHKVWIVSTEAINDDMTDVGASTGTPFDGVAWWPSLDLGNMGQNKQLDSFDLVVKGQVMVEFGYDQRDPTVLTTGYDLDGDTLPGTSIPFPLSAPSFAPKLTFAGGQADGWEWLATNLYIQDSQSTGFAG
jgi:hypothetical protein